MRNPYEVLDIAPTASSAGAPCRGGGQGDHFVKSKVLPEPLDPELSRCARGSEEMIALTFSNEDLMRG